jgi:hypothetical protein
MDGKSAQVQANLHHLSLSLQTRCYTGEKNVESRKSSIIGLLSSSIVDWSADFIPNKEINSTT